MPSQIDETVPVFGTPTTQSVRGNFSIAKSEITALQILTNGGPFLSINGGTLRGPLLLPNAPVINPLQAATKNYVDQTVATEAIWRGIYLVASNNPDLTPAVDHQNGYSWTCVTANPQVPEQLIVALPPLAAGTTIYNGDTLRYSTVEGGWDIIKGSALTVEVGEVLFVPVSGGTMTGPLILAGPPTSGLGAATKLYVDQVRTATTPAAIGAVPIAGGTMTGPLLLSGAPTAPSGAATKQYVDATVSSAVAPLAALASPAFTGAPVAPTPANADNSTRLATTGFVKATAASPISPAFSGVPTAPTASVGTASGQIATTGFVANGFLPLSGGTISGNLNITNQLVVFGLVTANGGAQVNGSIAVSANATITGTLSAANATISGNLNAAAVGAASAAISGSMTVGAGISANYLRSTGGAQIDGTLVGLTAITSVQFNSTGQYAAFRAEDRASPGSFFEFYAANGTAYIAGPQGGIVGFGNGQVFTSGGISLAVNSSIYSQGAAAQLVLSDRSQGGIVYALFGDAGFLQLNASGGISLAHWNRGTGYMTIGDALNCSGSGVVYRNIGSNGFNFRWDGYTFWGRVDNNVEVFLGNLSDVAAKTDIAPSTFPCLDMLRQLPLHQFRTAADTLVPVGLIAQDVIEQFPEAVHTPQQMEEGSPLSLKSDLLIAALIGGIQELADRLATVEGKLA